MSGQRIRLVVIERDIYARQAITSYLSWDRRTRVVEAFSAPHELLAAIKADPALARLDAVMLDTSLAANAETLTGLIKTINSHLPEADVICLSHDTNAEMALAAARAGARGYLEREEVGIGLASAVRFIVWHLFVVTENVARTLANSSYSIDFAYTPLPERRSYPRLTHRIEQALLLCVVEGLPAERAAEEMGVSVSTVRSYIKEGYRILEAEDETVYPAQISPAERAFLRYSALETVEIQFGDVRDQSAA